MKHSIALQGRREYIVVTILLLSLLLFGGVHLKNRLIYTTDSIEFFDFMMFVSMEYMPAERRATKKWPVELTSFRHNITTQKRYSDILSTMNPYILETYDREFKKLEVILTCSNSIVYRIHGKRFTVTCNSTVNPDTGNCHFDPIIPE